MPVASADFDDPWLRASYLVLAPARSAAALEPLLAWRRTQGLSAELFTWDEVYARFSAGAPDPRAVAALLEWAETRWAEAPRYLLIVGDASYDPWNFTGTARPADAPLAEQFDPSFPYRTYSDALLTGGADVAVGRLPTSDPQTLAAYADKVIAYESQVPTRPTNGVALSGNQSAGDPSFGDVAAQLIASARADGMALDANDTTPEELAAAWSDTDLVIYAGHGDSSAWSTNLLHRE
ncbi:MAG: C25 family cysteine peptidase, partial [Chloroflexota bacterium]